MRIVGMGIVYCFLAIATVTDIKDRVISDTVPLGILCGGGILMLYTEHTLFAGIVGVLLCGGLMLAASLYKDSFGGGDVKLIGALGFALGVAGTAELLVVALLTLLVAGYLIKKFFMPVDAMPLAPFVFFGTVVTQIILR